MMTSKISDLISCINDCRIDYENIYARNKNCENRFINILLRTSKRQSYGNDMEKSYAVLD